MAVYSDADRASLHAQLADQAFFIGPSAARESYLNKERILEVSISPYNACTYAIEILEFGRPCVWQCLGHRTGEEQQQ